MSPGSRAVATSLVICSRERSAMLLDALQCIVEGDEVPTEILVLEETSQRRSPVASFTTSRCTFRYEHTKIPTLAGKRNRGVQEASYDLVFFSDDDVLVPATWFGTILDALIRQGPGCVVSGRVVAGSAECSGAFAPSLHPITAQVAHRRRTTYSDPLAIFNCGFHRSAFDRIGDFDTRLGPGTPFPSCEDNDFGYRLLEAGFTIQCEPQALVYHRAWRPPADEPSLRRAYGRGQGAFYAKHLDLADPFTIKKMVAAWIRHGRRALVLDRRAVVAEAQWFTGFAQGFAGWATSHGVRPMGKP